MMSTTRTATLIALALAMPAAASAAPIVFSTVSDDPGMGLDYERTRSADYAVIRQYQEDSLIAPIDMMAPGLFPHRTGGFAGAAIIDHDGDGDLDVYISNGPDTPNSLFVNQLTETGTMSFVDEGVSAGVAATDQDSNGVCYGDIDNDGDEDLLVLGRHENNRLFLNDGTGSFSHAANSGLEGGTFSHIGCTMGDIDNDGYVDVFVGNAIDLSTQLAIVAVPFDFNEQNMLFSNDGDGTFTDVTATSGILDLVGMDSPDPQPPTISWAVSMVDIDRDGDIDIMHGDDQAAVSSSEEVGGGFDRGLLHILLNDGTGHFADMPIDENDFSNGAWMGLDYGDLDCDGDLDIFSSNLGDYAQVYAAPIFGFAPYELSEESSRYLFNNGDGSFSDPLNDGKASTFGWGTAVADLDNDGDQDAVYHGGLNMDVVAFQDNPGAIIVNEGCTGVFSENATGFPDTDYRQRGTHALAMGDLDRDGKLDMVTTSAHKVPDSITMDVAAVTYGSVWDGAEAFWLEFIPGPDGLTWNGTEMEPGSMTMEINSTESSNGWAVVEAKGGAGVITNGAVNRSGIGAVVEFEPIWGNKVASPVVAGSSYLSQHALERHFGMGSSPWGTAEVVWPGNVHNRLYFVASGEHVTMPEIPCDFETASSFWAYRSCVYDAVGEHYAAGEIDWWHSYRLKVSAIIAYFD